MSSGQRDGQEMKWSSKSPFQALLPPPGCTTCSRPLGVSSAPQRRSVTALRGGGVNLGHPAAGEREREGGREREKEGEVEGETGRER